VRRQAARTARAARLVGVETVATELAAMEAAIADVRARMERWYAEAEAADAAGRPDPPLLRLMLLVDEASSLVVMARRRTRPPAVAGSRRSSSTWARSPGSAVRPACTSCSPPSART
jgi:hypothetical protein